MARSRRGSRSSPDMKLAVCHPPYANMTGVMAAARAAQGERREARGTRGAATPGHEEQPDDDEHGDGGELEEHERGLGVGAAADAEAVDEGEDGQGAAWRATKSGMPRPVSSTV